jgi:hypothetical protein
MAGFLNLDDDPLGTASLGSGLKFRGTAPKPAIDRGAVARAGEAHGFTRTTDAPVPTGARRGRPPLNEQMTYWRIYVSPTLRDELNILRDQEGRRLNDLLRDMLAAYRAQKM